MSFESIKKLLHQKIGLNAASVGDSSIERAIKHRLSIKKCEDINQYYEKLLVEMEELTELVEEVVVPETWFFRNNTPFDAFSKFITDSIVPNLQRDEKIRVLSIPCSSGEEPYSAAISLHKAGIPMDKLHVDAFDISKRALTKAKRAIYGKNSFRGTEESLQNNYFKKGGAGYKLNDEIRNVVNFKFGNILVTPLSVAPEYYHAVFCRNLLIYFDRDTQNTVLQKIHRVLKDQGALFVGHAETALVTREIFTQLYSARSFGYIKVGTADANKLKCDENKPINIPDRWKIIFEQLAKIPMGEKKSLSIASKHLKNQRDKNLSSTADREFIRPKVSLLSVERLVTQSKYSEAIELCRQYLKEKVDSADGYYLLGLVLDRDGQDVEADQMLRKAIYLNPNHEKALKLAASLAENRGDIEAALSYKRRIKRVTTRKPDTSNPS